MTKAKIAAPAPAIAAETTLPVIASFADVHGDDETTEALGHAQTLATVKAALADLDKAEQTGGSMVERARDATALALWDALGSGVGLDEVRDAIGQRFGFRPLTKDTKTAKAGEPGKSLARSPGKSVFDKLARLHRVASHINGAEPMKWMSDVDSEAASVIVNGFNAGEVGLATAYADLQKLKPRAEGEADNESVKAISKLAARIADYQFDTVSAICESRDLAKAYGQLSAAMTMTLKNIETFKATGELPDNAGDDE